MKSTFERYMNVIYKAMTYATLFSFQSIYISLRLISPSLFPARHDISTLRNLVHIRELTAASYLHQAVKLQCWKSCTENLVL